MERRFEERIDKLDELSYIEIPRDLNDSDYVSSFEVSDRLSARSFFDEYGFVVSYLVVLLLILHLT